jgi:hypothetical protein
MQEMNILIRLSTISDPYLDISLFLSSTFYKPVMIPLPCTSVQNLLPAVKSYIMKHLNDARLSKQLNIQSKSSHEQVDFTKSLLLFPSG